MASSIEVSILAKIEGWRELLKQIENAASKIDVGSGIGKNILKEFDILSKLVDRFSQHLTLKITSADLIDHLLLSLSLVDEGFKVIGNTIASVSFEDLKPEYLTDSFKDLINLIKLTELELSSGLESSFLNAVKGSDKLLETFSKLKLDPSKMNISEAGLALTNYAETLALLVTDGNKEIDSMLERLKNLRETAKSMLNLSIMKMGDTTAVARDAIGNTSDIGKFAINKDVITSVSRTVENALINYADLLKSKKEEIELTLKELIDADTIDQARDKLNALSELFNNTGLRGKIHFEASDVKNFSKLLELYIPDETVISERLERIRHLLIDNGISEADLNKIMPNADKLLHNGGFDELSNKIAEALNKSKHVAENGVTAINEEIKKLSAELNEKRSSTMKVAAERYKADRSVEEYKNLLIQILNENKDLKNRVEQLEKILHSQATEDVLKTGASISKNSLDNLNGAANAAKMYRTELEQVQAREQMIGKILGVVQRWFSIYAAIRMVGNAVRSVISTIKELDATITEIAIVTNMTQSQLWKQMNSYTTLARLYAASISGVYQVSLLYYQQGLGQSDVMALTELTLKMARISGLDYALATDYMTNAVRSFKMEMTEAATVVDVYSAVAAASATDTTELASAMSKTASSAQAVGSSFENTTAMMAVMIEATRESAENIGSAMKSIISRYGEMTSDPSKLIDSEGLAMSLNRVDKALLTVGISIHDALGQFRLFDDVIMELASSWDTIDTNTLRYIATIMAGNRQQSRFLALVSSYDRLKQLSETAMNSEDASQLLFLKTLDSVAAKTQLLETSLQTLYVSSGLEETYKGILDITNNIIKSFTDMPTILGKPIPAILKIGTTFFSVANAVTTLFGVLKHKVNLLIQALSGESAALTANVEAQITTLLLLQIDKRIAAQLKYYTTIEALLLGASAELAIKIGQSTYNMLLLNILLGENVKQANFFTKFGKGTRNAAIVSVVANLAGSFISTFASTLLEESQRELKASATVLGGTLQGIGIGSMFGAPGMIIGGIAGFVKSYIEGINIVVESSEEKLERLKKTAEEANNKRIESTVNYNNLKSELDQIKELEKTYNDSAEAKAEYYEHSNALAELYPLLVLAYDTEGNAVLNLTNAYKVLKQAKDEASDNNTSSMVASLNEAEELEKQAKEKYESAYTTRNSSSITSLLFKNDSLVSLDNNGLKNLLISTMNQNKGLIGAATILESIFNTSNLDAISENSSLINQLLSYSYGFGDAYTLDNIFKSGDNLLNLKTEISAISDKNLLESLQWFVETIENALQELLPEEGNYLAAKFQTDSLRKKAIADYTKDRITDLTLDALYNNGAPAEYLSEFSEINAIINSLIYDLMIAAKEYTEAKGETFDYQKWFDSPKLSSAYDTLFSTLSAFWDGLDPTKLSDFNKLLQLRGKLSEGLFKELLRKFPGIVDSSGRFFTWVGELIEYYDDAFDFDLFEAARKKRIEARNNTKDLKIDVILEAQSKILESLGPQELSNLLKIYDLLEKEINSNIISEDSAGLIFDLYLLAFNTSSEEIQSLLFDTDIFSFSSIMDTIHKLEGEEFDSEEVLPAIDALRQIGHLIPLNLNTETLTLLDKFNDGLSDFENSVKNATKGMNFKTMSEEVNKLNLSFDSYELKDGKYYIKDYVTLSNSLIEQLAGIFSDLNAELDARKTEAKQKTGYAGSILGLTYEETNELQKLFVNDLNRESDNLVDYYFELKSRELNSSMGEAEKYTRDLLARSALEAGRIADFALLTMGNENWNNLTADSLAAIIGAVAKGDISELTAEQQEYFSQYNSLIISTYQDIQLNIASSLMSSLANGSGRIKVTDTNKDQLLQLLNKGWLKNGNLDTGNYTEIAIEELQKNESDFIQYVLSAYDNENDRIKALKEYHANKYKSNNTINTLSKVAESNIIAYDDYIDYLTSIGYTSDDLKNSETLNNIIETDGLKMNAAGNLVVDNIEAWIADLTNTMEELPENASVEERNDLKAKIANAHNLLVQALKKAVEDAVSNYDKITVDLKTALANALKVPIELLDQYFTLNADGLTSTFDIVGFLLAIQDGNITIGEAAEQYLISGIATLYDNALSAITNTHKLAISGTTNMAEMLKFVDSYNIKLNSKKTVQDLFKYNDIIGGFVVDPRVTQKYILVQVQELVQAGLLKPEDISSYIKTNAAKNIDISKYLSSERTSVDLATLNASLVSYYASIIAMPIEGLVNYEEELTNWQVEVQNQALKAIDIIEGGGLAAVDKMLEIDPQATSEQLQAAYEALIAPIKAAAELVDSLEVGSFVATENIEALTEAGFTIESNVVVKTAENLVDAYKSLYDLMAATGEATISSLNILYATMLDAADLQNIDAIEVLQNATGLTYSSLGEILSRLNIKLEDVMSNQLQYGILTTNFGKIIVANWTAFAKEVFGADDIDAIRNNPEYLSAFKTYNDSLIELNKTIEDDIADEISLLSSAKRGDWLNLTNLYVAFERAIQKTIDETDFSEFNSNIPNLGRRAIVSSETMQKAFGDNFAWDDYGTIYGKTFTAKLLNAQVSSNVGMSFALIDENGIPVKDIDAYANELILKSINLFGKVTAATIKYIDSTERNLLIDINDFANDLEDAEVWNKQDAKSILAHEREAETSYGRSLYARLHLFGASFENGILKISEEANLLGVAETISEIAHSTGIDLGADLAEIEDTIHSILQSYTDAIVKGISGGLTNAEALDLQEKAFDMGLGELSFDETAEGLKLALNSAIELYDRLKLIDGLQGRLVFDALNKSLLESNEHYLNISDIANRIAWIEDESHPERAELYRQELELAKEIYAVRSTTEDSSFNFMSNAIPSGLNNPINYYKNWASAIRTFNDALKNKGSYTKDGKTYKSGFVDYDYWYNLVTEMNNIAALGGNIEFAGETLDGSLEAASRLILKGAASLVATNTGDIKVALNGMSLDFEAGANNFSSGVTDGIQAMAKSLIEMLDGMIQLLETVVAMEKLGDITGENDTIDISDLFPSIDWKDGKNHIIENEQAINWINNEVLTADADSELGKFIDNALLNNRTVRDTLKAAVTESEGINEETAAALSSLLNSLWQMYISNDYNLNDPYNSLLLIANASNLDMVIPIGDAKVIIERGAMIVEEKDKNGEAVWKDVLGNTYKDLDEAFAAAMMSALGIDTKAKDYKYNAGTKTATGTLTIDNNTVTVTRLSNGSMSFVDTEGNTGTTLNEYIETIIAKLPEEVLAQKRIQLLLLTGAITLDSVSYRAIDEKLRQELEAAFSNGDTIKINRIIEEHAEFKSLKGKTAEEQAKILGLELNTLIINIEANTINATGPIEELQEALDKLQDKTITITTVEKTISDAEKRRKDALERNYVYDGDFATGNLGLAKAKGTLMGELGPELVVSLGHYYVVGQNGPEMVDLAEDAIVFNHLLTKSLLEKGTSTGRGKAVTNERTAIAFASGSIHGGPAMASATALLATLKELRTQWQALAGLSAKDLAGAGGSGGGGGGGGNSDTTKAFIKDLEKWYNWLLEIDKLEEHINYLETLRSKIQSDMVAHGQDYFLSLLVSLDNLLKEVAVLKDLYKSLEEYFNKRKNYFNSTDNPFSSLYEFDELGQLKYKAGKLELLSYMSGTDQYGAPNMTAKELYDYIVNTLGIDTSYLKYDDEGNEIKLYDDDGKENSDYYTNIVQAFWDKIDADKEEMLSLHDSVEEHKKAVLEKQQAMNEIMKDVEDNLIAVENKVYDALVDSRERAIEELEKTKDAIEESANKLIDGLLKQLDNERDMYEAQNNKDELIKLQRLLSILLRSGASTSEMASLLTQITLKLQDNYFEDLLMQIDAIQEASNNELEKLLQQIDLETEMLAYEKENGLLWSQVYDIMHGNSADGIAEYIAKNNSEYWGKSPTEIIEALREDLFKALRWEDFTKKFDNLDTLINYYTNILQGTDGNKESADEIANNINGSSSNNSSGSETKGTASGTVSNTGGTWKSDDTGWWYQYTGGSWATGWKNIDGKDYYFNDKGYMQTGWIQGSDGKWYYLGADGAMVTGTLSIDGKTWNFSETGAWDGKDGVAEVTENAVQENTEETTTKTNTEKLKGWHVDGLTGVYGSKQLAINARQAKAEEYNGNSTLYDFWSNKKIKYYSEGGLDDYTGPVILHGTKAKPEAVLNASQTHILRDDILSNKPNSLLSLLSAWRDSVIGLADTSNINTNYDNGITIEKAEVIMQVHQIANDYDAQRAGEQALDKIMGIARKTIAQNRIGR